MVGPGQPRQPTDAEVASVARWWASKIGERSTRTNLPRHLRLHVSYVLPFQRRETVDAAPLRELMRHRGVSWRLHLAAVYLAQLYASGNSRVAPGVPRLPYSSDVVDDDGVLRTPSWASLVVGFESAVSARGLRLRDDLVVRSFRRLEASELAERLPPARARNWRLLLEHRPWRNQTVDSRVYRVPRRPSSWIEVPAEFFSRGWYLRFAPTACHYLLATAAVEKRGWRSASPGAMSRESRLQAERSLNDEPEGEEAMTLFLHHVRASNVREWNGKRVVTPPFRFENTMDWWLRPVDAEGSPGQSPS